MGSRHLADLMTDFTCFVISSGADKYLKSAATLIAERIVMAFFSNNRYL